MNWNTYRYIGLNPIEATYYEGWYMIKNVIKYTNLKISGGVQDEVIYIVSLDILISPEQLHEEQLEAA